MKREDSYQIALIGLGILSVVGVGVFFYRELFPEYRIYQNTYKSLEEFRSTYTGDPPPPFKEGIKQIVIERADKGPAVIDRCTSCHVALQFPHFSSTRLAHDLNGQLLYDSQGLPVKESNPDYIWSRLDTKIAELKNAGNIQEAEQLANLKIADVDGHRYDMEKVLVMHPLMGSETRPFEFHPVDTYGCTSCHNGNGRGLTTEKAHGPVFDGEYEKEFVGYVPQFLEKDPQNDPKFSKVFNGKPGNELLFQTSPLYVGALIQSKCMQCHVSTSSALENAAFSTVALIQQHQARTETIQKAFNQEKTALLDNMRLSKEVQAQGIAKTIERLKALSQNYQEPANVRERAASQSAFIQKHTSDLVGDAAKTSLVDELQKLSIAMLGSQEAFQQLDQQLTISVNWNQTLDHFLDQAPVNQAYGGTLFAKQAALKLTKAVEKHVDDVEMSFSQGALDEKTISTMASEIDLLTYNYQRGQELFISQACYACHRIAGFSRGGVGPELTNEGKAYPWYVKQKISWPQSDLKTSTMPNMKIDHEELQDLLTFVLSQFGENQSVSSTVYKSTIQKWESGQKKNWEKPISPAQMLDVNYAMTVFATEGCAACHRLEGFESNTGFAVEREHAADFTTIQKEKEWFVALFPENILGSQIVQQIDAHEAEIDNRIVDHIRQGAILEEIEEKYPSVIESFYTPFKFAARAKETAFKNDPQKLSAWKKRVHRVLMMYIQQYGLGRLIGPRPNWSGIYRTDEWLMEHFHNPASHVPRSIMPVLPFDDTKFYALTHMLDVLGIRNRDTAREEWKQAGFNPAKAYALHCSQCHGDYKLGNGPVAEWIYPIPKNLGDGNFLRHLTKEQAIASIRHGVKGTPMSPWGEAAEKPGVNGIPVLTDEEIRKLVDWLYAFLPVEDSTQIPKWKYSPDDVIRELHKEGNELHPQSHESSSLPPELSALPKGEHYFASLSLPKFSKTSEVNKYFEIVPHSSSGEEKSSYYIKKEFYTSKNIEEGKAFFEMNCAVCHGKEADGAGIRAEAMHDAKPRMLTNLDWLRAHDDMRLLRSIKYGVPGTAMTPWGDFTSSLQRMQLVIFIRSLSESVEERAALGEAIYKAFESADQVLETARAYEYPKIAALEKAYAITQDERRILYQEATQDASLSKKATEAYQTELTALNEIRQLKAFDEIYLQMKGNLKKERELYEGIGKGLLTQTDENASFDLLLQAIQLLDGAYQFADNRFTYVFDNEKEKQLSVLGTQIQENLEKKIVRLSDQKKQPHESANAENSPLLAEINGQLTTTVKLRNAVIAAFAEGQRLREQQRTLYETLMRKLKPLP